MKTLRNLLVIFSIIISAQASAQFSIGIKGGFTKAWEDYGDVDLPEDAEIDVSGFNISGLAYYRLNNYLQVGIEPGYIQRGAACVPGWNGGFDPIFEGDTKLFLNYAELPLMVSGNVSFFQKKFEIFGKAGYGLTFLTTAYSEEIDLGSDEPAIRTKLTLDDDSSNLNRWDHGFYGGLGIAYNLGRNQFFVESDYFMGLKDAERSNTSKNRSIDFSIGYLIRL